MSATMRDPHPDPRAAALPTPFHSRTSVLCRTNDWARWAGYTTVQVFTDVELEYFAIRNASTLFDLSPMIKYRITGPDVVRYLNRLVTRDVAKLRPGRVAYIVWCDDRGKVLDDGTLFRLSDSEFHLCSQERHLCWLLDSAVGFDVAVDDVSEDVAALALQGPTSCAVLKRLGLAGADMIKPFHIEHFSFEGESLMVSRTGFTGDLGYELWIAPRMAEVLWDRLVEAGNEHGITPIGSQALELARIEAGFIATNLDFMAADQAVRTNRGRSPFELGLGRLVDFDKGHFNGRRALLEERRRGSRYCLVALEVEGNKPAGEALVYYKKTKQVGHITSAMWSPICKRNLALASLTLPYGDSIRDNLWVDIYTHRELKWLRTMACCRIVERPFFDPARRRATPAPDF
jgi:glycine cleavage system T protein (aminomethyltransferase)